MKTLFFKLEALIMIGLTVATFASSAVQTDNTLLPQVILSGENGGLTDGSEWNSSSLKNKVNLVFYVDPDKQGEMKPLITILDSLKHSPDVLGKTFIINMSATLIPNFILGKKVAERAKLKKNITYVLDRERVLVKKWDLVDDDINILLVDKSGDISLRHSGKISKGQIIKIIQKIEKTINKGEI